MHHIDNFIGFMATVGCSPANASDIVSTGDGRWKDYQLSGDPKGKKKGFYTLKTDGEYASGACGDRRNGEIHRWYGKPGRKLSDQEKREYAKKREEDRKSRESEEKDRHRKVSEKAADQWKSAKRGDHEYLKKKGIKGEGTKVSGGKLLVPMYADGVMWGIQTIDSDGGKMFPAGGRKKGCYCPLTTAAEEKAVIALAEGYATASSVREATGWPTLACFDAGNLVRVAKAMRDKYPLSKIVICGDYDSSGTGQKKAEEAAEAVNGFAIWPEILDQDWNDIAQSHGIDYVKNSIAAVMDRRERESIPSDVVSLDDSLPPPISESEYHEYLDSIPPIESYTDEARAEITLYTNTANDDYEPNWREGLNYNDEGKLTAKSLGNVSLFLGNHDNFRNMFCYDEFAHEKIIVQCPPWEKPERFKPRPITDEDMTWLCVGLEKRGLTLDMAKVKKVMDAVVMRKRRNPAQEYMKSLVWDGVPRLHRWLSYYAGAESEPADYLSAVGTIWMVAAVARIFEPGTKFDHMLILEGNQGTGKSSLLRELATINKKAYFDDTIKANELGSTAIVPKLQGVMIIEIAELAGLRKADIETFKQQITIQEDRIVKKYSNEPTRYPRQFILAGTFNLVQGYLDDPTGNRRMWPVKVGKIDLEALRVDKAQIWAEAVQLYRNGHQLYLPKEMWPVLEHVQMTRKIVHPWMPDLETLSRDRSFVTSQEIWEALVIEKAKRTQYASSDISKIMVELGYEYGRSQNGGNRVYGWKKKGQLV